MLQGQQYPDEEQDIIADRFTRLNDMISKSKYRTIHRGFDGESGCEIAWSTYRLQPATDSLKKQKLIKAINDLQNLSHKHLLSVIYFQVRPSKQFPNEEELVMITELITAGSIRE